MKIEIKYELPIFSQSLEKDPIVKSKDMDMEIELFGTDDKDKLRTIIIKFSAVLCNKYTSARFTPRLYDSYDRIVELVDSEWLEELKGMNERDFSYWNPKHYVIYLDEIGMFQFIAREYEVIDSE